MGTFFDNMSPGMQFLLNFALLFVLVALWFIFFSTWDKIDNIITENRERQEKTPGTKKYIEYQKKKEQEERYMQERKKEEEEEEMNRLSCDHDWVLHTMGGIGDAYGDYSRCSKCGKEK